MLLRCVLSSRYIPIRLTVALALSAPSPLNIFVYASLIPFIPSGQSSLSRSLVRRREEGKEVRAFEPYGPIVFPKARHALW